MNIKINKWKIPTLIGATFLVGVGLGCNTAAATPKSLKVVNRGVNSLEVDSNDINNYIKITDLGDWKPTNNQAQELFQLIRSQIVNRINVVNHTNFTNADLGVTDFDPHAPAAGSATIYGNGDWTGELKVTWSKKSASTKSSAPKDISDYIKITNLGDFQPNFSNETHDDIITKINELNNTTFTRRDVGVDIADDSLSASMYGWGYSGVVCDWTGILTITWDQLPNPSLDVNNAIQIKDLGETVHEISKKIQMDERLILLAINQVNGTEFNMKGDGWSSESYDWGRDLKVPKIVDKLKGGGPSYATITGVGKYHGTCTVTWNSYLNF